MPKQRSRRGEPVPHDAALVLRGDELDPGLLTETAQENSVIYRFFGISVSSRLEASAGRRSPRSASSEPSGLQSSPLEISSGLASSCGTPAELRITMWCTSGARSWSPGSSVARTASWRIRTTSRPREVPDNEDRPSSRPQPRGR
jgi:hypothetical protein